MSPEQQLCAAFGVGLLAGLILGALFVLSCITRRKAARRGNGYAGSEDYSPRRNVTGR